MTGETRTVFADNNGKIESLFVENGESVKVGQIVVAVRIKLPNTDEIRAQYDYFEEDKDEIIVRKVYKSKVEGIFYCKLKDLDEFEVGNALFNVHEECDHSMHFSNMCALCGKNLDVNLASVGHDNVVTVSLNVATKMEQETMSRLRKQKKLSLILDLDQTLIHATADPAVGEWMNGQEKLHDLFRFYLDDGPMEYYLRLRPGLHEFLHKVQQCYELHIYTMGSRLYATKVASIIDPDGELFRERVLSRDESGSIQRKSLHRLFPCDQSMVVVVDDRGDMWDWTENLIRVHPYNFFIRTGDINGKALISSDSSTPVRVGDNDKELKILLKKLLELHSVFYNSNNSDVRLLLPQMKSMVLQGCEIVLMEDLSSEPWMLATSFGAKCTHEITNSTTHVVSKSSNTLTLEAKNQGIFAVSYVWLYTSISYWKRQPEQKFEIIDELDLLDKELEQLEENEQNYGGFQDIEVFSDLAREMEDWLLQEHEENSSKRIKLDLDESDYSIDSE